MALFNNDEKGRLAQLCTLVYLEDVTNRNGATIGEVVADLLNKNGLEKSHDLTMIGERDEYPCWMSKEEWIKVLNDLKKDPELCSYTIREGVAKNDLHAMCCVKENNNPADKDHKNNKDQDAIVVIRGGGGEQYVWRGRDDISPEPPTPEEKERRIWRETEQGVGHFEEISAWHDDGEGGYRSITEKMALALNYVKNLPYTDLTIAGHSSAGRDAQATAILLSDKVKKCFSFDGQGFSKEFIKEFRKEIIDNCHNILSLSPKNSFVNCLLPTIAGTREYVDAHPKDFANPNTEKESRGLLSELKEALGKQTRKLTDYPRNHCPHIVFNEQGGLRQLTKQGALPRLINQYTTYAVTTLKDSQKKYTLDGLMGNLEKTPNRESARQRMMAAVILGSLAPGFVWNQIKEKPNTDIHSVIKKLEKFEGKKETAQEEAAQRLGKNLEIKEEGNTEQSPQALITLGLNGFIINEKRANEASKEDILASLQDLYNSIETSITNTQKVERQKMNSLYYAKLQKDQTFTSSPDFNYLKKSNALDINYHTTLMLMTDSFLHAVEKLNTNDSKQHFEILSDFTKSITTSLENYEKENKKITKIDVKEINKTPAKQHEKQIIQECTIGSR